MTDTSSRRRSVLGIILNIGLFSIGPMVIRKVIAVVKDGRVIRKNAS